VEPVTRPESIHPPGGLALVSRVTLSPLDVAPDGAIRGCPACVEGIKSQPLR
jgi:hypothetical protein